MASFISLKSGDPEGILGAPAESDYRADTFTADEDINPGVVCLRDASTKRLMAPTSAAEVARAECVVLYDPLHVPASDSVMYDQFDSVPGMRRGVIWAKNEEAMTIDDPVYVRHTANGSNTVLGAIRPDGDPASADATDAVLGLTETDANVEDGTFVVILEDTEDGAQYQVEFTSSTTTHANAAQGIADAIAAAAPATATPGAEVANKIDITIVHANSAYALKILHVESVGASALSVVTQGAAASEGDTCTLHTGLKVDRDASTADLCRLRVNLT